VRDFETCLESTDDCLGIWNLGEMVKSSGEKRPGTYLGPCLEFRLEFRESIDLYLNIYT
jgi:hypothetical protein